MTQNSATEQPTYELVSQATPIALRRKGLVTSCTELCCPGMQLADVTTTLRKRWRVIIMLQPGPS